MSKVQERGLREVLAEAEALARVLRAMSDGKIDLQPVLIQARTRPLEMSWGEAKTEALAIAGAHNHMPEMSFAPHLMSMIRSGRKTLTYRLGTKYATLEPGTAMTAVCPGQEPIPVMITGRWGEVFGSLPLADPRHETYSSKDQMHEVFEGYYGRPVDDGEPAIVLAFRRTRPDSGELKQTPPFS